MKTIFLLFILIAFTICTYLINTPQAVAQTPKAYCTPPAFITGPYTGITNVQLGTLNNTSPYNDGYKYFSTITPPSLVKGVQYTVSITTLDNAGSGLNLRVWIDWNQDTDFDDVGEEAGSWNNIGSVTSTMSITIPSTAVLGTTRMRVYDDMVVASGHITPEPCGYLNYPSHPIGQHGEIEDYDIMIATTTSLVEADMPANKLLIYSYPGGDVRIGYDLLERSDVTLEIYNILGEIMTTLVNYTQTHGHYSFDFSQKDSYYLSDNIYLVKLSINGSTFTRKFRTF